MAKKSENRCSAYNNSTDTFRPKMSPNMAKDQMEESLTLDQVRIPVLSRLVGLVQT